MRLEAPAIFGHQANPPNPPAGHSLLYPKSDGKFYAKDATGSEVAVGDTGGGGDGGDGVTVHQVAQDRVFTSAGYADISDWTIPLPAGEVVTLDGILVFHSSATTNGFGFGARPRTVGDLADLVVNRFLVVLEYQTGAGSWVTTTQTSPTTLMAATATTYVANSGVLCRITGQIDVGLLPGELHIQARSETGAGSITVRRGSPIRVM